MIDMAKVPSYGSYNRQGMGYQTLGGSRPRVQGQTGPAGSTTVGQTPVGAAGPGPAPAPTVTARTQTAVNAPAAPQAPTNSGQQLPFWTPQEMGQAGQVYQGLARGQYQIPQSLQYANQQTQQLINQGGNPGSTQAWQQAYQPVLNKQLEDIRKQAMESANMEGLGDSSVLGTQIANQQGDLVNQYNLGLAQQQMGLDESAKSRVMQGLGLMGGYAGQEIGADQFGQNMALQGAQGLQNLGQQYWRMPFDVSGQMSGLGGQYNQLGVTPEDQAYMAALQGYSGLQGQNQYTPGFGTQMANVLGAGAQLYNSGFFNGPGGATAAPTGVPSTLAQGFSLVPPQYNPYGFSLAPQYNPSGFSLAGGTR